MQAEKSQLRIAIQLSSSGSQPSEYCCLRLSLRARGKKKPVANCNTIQFLWLPTLQILLPSLKFKSKRKDWRRSRNRNWTRCKGRFSACFENTSDKIRPSCDSEGNIMVTLNSNNILNSNTVLKRGAITWMPRIFFYDCYRLWKPSSRNAEQPEDLPRSSSTTSLMARRTGLYPLLAVLQGPGAALYHNFNDEELLRKRGWGQSSRCEVKPKKGIKWNNCMRHS